MFIWTSVPGCPIDLMVIDQKRPQKPKAQARLSRPGDAVLVIGELLQAKFIFNMNDDSETCGYRMGDITMVYFPTVPRLNIEQLPEVVMV